jgi:hypothetical protein
MSVLGSIDVEAMLKAGSRDDETGESHSKTRRGGGGRGTGAGKGVGSKGQIVASSSSAAAAAIEGAPPARTKKAAKSEHRDVMDQLVIAEAKLSLQTANIVGESSARNSYTVLLPSAAKACTVINMAVRAFIDATKNQRGHSQGIPAWNAWKALIMLFVLTLKPLFPEVGDMDVDDLNGVEEPKRSYFILKRHLEYLADSPLKYRVSIYTCTCHKAFQEGTSKITFSINPSLTDVITSVLGVFEGMENVSVKVGQAPKSANQRLVQTLLDQVRNSV